MGGAAGALLQRAIEIDAALDAGFVVTLDDITAEEWAALLILKAERNRYDQQKHDDSQRKNSGFPPQLPNRG